MTGGKSGAGDQRFVTTTLPLLLGAGGVLLYLVTLNHWISLQSLATVARVSGWLWQPEVGQPLTILVLYPFHWLPAAWVPLGLNLFHAVCAAVALALLARSVALVRYDLPPPKGFGKSTPSKILSTPAAWMPPVLAVVLCGLQLSFWEHATSSSGEMIDLLLFASVVRCVLEFRIDQNESWLLRAALAYGVGMANNWVMVGYFPVFLIAAVRARGLGAFFVGRFWLRMALWGAAGLSLYLLLPTVQHFSSHGQLEFWPALKTYLKSQKDALHVWRSPALRTLMLASLLPFLLLSIPWKSHSVQLSDDSRLGVFLIRATGHFAHAVFFAASLWLAFDPPFSPQAVNPGMPMLTFYYMSALVGGYCAGYFLLFDAGGVRRTVGQLAIAVTWFLLCALPLLLVARNLGVILSTNGPLLHDFAKAVYGDLPPGKSVVLVDDWKEVILLQGEANARRVEKQPILLDTASLASVRYQAAMARQFESRWPMPVPANRVEVVRPGKILKLISAFRAHEPVIYLDPAFNFLLERFTQEPLGFVRALEPRPARETASQTLSVSTVATNEQIWQKRWQDTLRNLSRRTLEQSNSGAGWFGTMFVTAGLKSHRNLTVHFLGAVSSRALDYWGVQMRRAGRPAEAATWFQRAIELNPDNLAARINLEYHQRCQQGDCARLNAPAIRRQFATLFGQGEHWGEVLIRDGPVDEPTFLFRSGRVLLATGNSRQAAGDFARSAELAPEWPAPKIWLAQSCLELQNFESVLELTEAVQAANPPEAGTPLAQLLYCRTMALRGLGRTNEATACIEGFLGRYRTNSEVLSTAADLYGQGGQYEQQLSLLEQLLERDPARSELLMKRGIAELKLSQYETAIGTLTKALSLTPSDGDARLSRAVAYLGTDQLDAARGDYEALLGKPETSGDALFGLGTIAWRQQNTNSAIQFYQQYLSNAIPRSPQYALAAERLEQLKKPAKR
jgi:tetratricopeptide (TPR) repeat protein